MRVVLPLLSGALVAVLCLSSLPLAAQVLPARAAAPASAVAASSPPHAHAIDTRAARVRGLAEQMNQPDEQLRSACRFESDIATPPPAGAVALSFDDGPEPGANEAIQALLSKYQVPAGFFLIAAKAQRHPELTASLRANRWATVGNHSWSHPNFHDIAPERQQTELDRSDAALALTPGAKLFRYPYGNASCAANERARSLGYRIVGWHVDSCDWAFDKTGSIDPHEAKICGVAKADREHFVEHVVNALKARRGGIVLMHEIHPHTLAQLETLIQRLQAEGFRFVALDDPALGNSLH